VHNTLYVEVMGSTSESGFSLDEMVTRVKVLFETKAMAKVVGLLLTLVDDHLCWNLVDGRKSWKPKGCCRDVLYEHKDKLERRFRTSLGTVKIRWWRLKCRKCGRTVVPLREFLGLGLFESKSAEMEKMVAEVVSEQSYRRTSRHLDLIGEIPVPKSTAHRWVMESECDALKVDGKTIGIVVADGTGYKRRPDEKKSNRGDLKVVLGVDSTGTVIPIGAWGEENWEDIGKEIRDNAVKWKKKGKILVCDGETGLAEAMASLVERTQRCHWHAAHELDIFMWKDKAPLDARKTAQHRIAGLIGVELPEEDFEKVKDSDKTAVLEKAEKAEEEIERLIGELMNRGYTKAATYVRNAKASLFSYVRFWLKYGLVCPRASSMIERMMRELGRRLKKIAFGWSDKGAAKMARIIIKRITSAGEWDEYWKKRLRLDGNVAIILRGVTAR
jgi:hypothetical protein